MDDAQSLLFGDFPRSVGVTTPDHPSMDLRQFEVHSPAEFDGVMETIGGNKNAYVSIAEFRPVLRDEFAGCQVVVDKVYYDLDSPAKGGREAPEDWVSPLIDDYADDREVIRWMRNDDDVLHEVLGDACDDARKLAETCIREDIPTIGVFSGFGIHVYQLYEPTASHPGSKIGSTAKKYTAELSLGTVDEKPIGDAQRITRVPNLERVDDAHQEATGLYQVPLSAEEMAGIQPEELIGHSRQPREEIASEPSERPRLKEQKDYLGPDPEEEDLGQDKMLPVGQEADANELAETLVKEVCRMPCVYERALTANPDHPVRVKLGIMFLNAGYKPTEIADIIGQLGWVDYDRDKTMYFLENLQENGKGDWSCKTMQGKGLCTRADDKPECPTYGYRGGNQP